MPSNIFTDKYWNTSLSYLRNFYNIPVEVSYAVCVVEEFQGHLALIHPVLCKGMYNKKRAHKAMLLTKGNSNGKLKF